MNLKKILSTTLAAMMIAAMSVSAYAAGFATPDADGNISIGKDEVTIGIEGRVEPVTIAATCNISTYLSIDPNQPEGSQFTSPVITVTNDCNAPLDLYAVGMKATGSAPKVVDHEKYDENGWKQLSNRETHENIALGLIAASGDNVDMWFAEESAQGQVKVCDIPSRGEQKMKLQSNFGRAWDGGENFKYAMTVKIGLKQ